MWLESFSPIEFNSQESSSLPSGFQSNNSYLGILSSEDLEAAVHFKLQILLGWGKSYGLKQPLILYLK